MLLDDKGEAEPRLARGLVPAREGAARVRGLKLRDGHPARVQRERVVVAAAERRPVEPREAVRERRREAELHRDVARGAVRVRRERLGRVHDEHVRVRGVAAQRAGADDARRAGARAVAHGEADALERDVEPDGVEGHRVDRAVHAQVHGLVAREHAARHVDAERELVQQRVDGAGQRGVRAAGFLSSLWVRQQQHQHHARRRRQGRRSQAPARQVCGTTYMVLCHLLSPLSPSRSLSLSVLSLVLTTRSLAHSRFVSFWCWCR